MGRKPWKKWRERRVSPLATCFGICFSQNAQFLGRSLAGTSMGLTNGPGTPLSERLSLVLSRRRRALCGRKPKPRYALGPFDARETDEQIGVLCAPAPRVGLRQRDSVRPIDDFSVFGQNSTSSSGISCS